MKTFVTAIGLTVGLALGSTAAADADTARTPAPSWHACADAPAEAQCADIQVPLSWARPDGPTISLHVSRLPALDPTHRIGAMVVVPGGPGIPGAEVMAEQGRMLAPAAIQQRFDVIGFDPPGVGASTAVTCGGAALPTDVAVFPRTRAQFEAVEHQSAAYGASCVRNSAPGLVANVDAVSAARDLDVIRAALGERTISYLGFSWATLLGQNYARLFPHRIRTMVLDGAIDHAIGARTFLTQQASELSTVFGQFARWCSQAASCALHGQNVTALWDGLLARATQTPIPAPHAAGGATTVNADTIRMVLPVLLEDGPTSSIVPSTWKTLGKALAQTQAGDASLLADNSEVGQPKDAYTAMSCQDFPPQLHGYADAADRLKQINFPHTGATSEAWLMTDLCSQWPARSADPWAPQRITGTRPILVANTRYDPSSPVEWAHGLHREIKNSGLLVANAAGHLAFFNSDCARTAETNYLMTGRLPVPDVCSS